MPGYYVHLASCGGTTLGNRNFVLGVEAPDILKKYVKILGGIDGVRAKYEAICTKDSPKFQELEERIKQKERYGSTDGLHYGLSSSPNIMAFWNTLSDQQRRNSFYKGYAWHLLTDAIIYQRLAIDKKFQIFLEKNAQKPNLEQLREGEVKKLHTDWDKINALIHETYPEVSLTEEVKELGVVKYIHGEELVYVNWPILKVTIDYLRNFDPINGDLLAIIKTIMNNR